jgi:peptidoglycan-N-acetylglucosamine deacetylase
MPSPRVLLSIDYEPWFALVRRFDGLSGTNERRDLDGGFTRLAIDRILEVLGDAQASFYLVGEVADWYPEVPQKIVAAGHELGFHCQIHRPLVSVDDVARDLQSSSSWRKQYSVRGYRAPMVHTIEDIYSTLEQADFAYSSSIYGQAGHVLQKGKIWEIPVSTYRFFGRKDSPLQAPRYFTMKLLLGGELPYGSSFTIGLLRNYVIRILEKELSLGRSPVIFLHPYEIVRPENWPRRLGWDLATHPQLLPFIVNKSVFLDKLLRSFPISSLVSYLDEFLALRGEAGA